MREIVREPLKAVPRARRSRCCKEYAWAFPAFQRPAEADARGRRPRRRRLQEPLGGGPRRRPRVRLPALLRDERPVRHARALPGDGRPPEGHRRQRDRLPDRLRRRHRHGARRACRTSTRSGGSANAAAGRPPAAADAPTRPRPTSRSPPSSPATASPTCSARRRWRACSRCRTTPGRPGRGRAPLHRRRGVPGGAGQGPARRCRASGSVTNMYGPDRDDDLVDHVAARGRPRRHPDRHADRQHADLHPRRAPPAGASRRAPASCGSAATASCAATTSGPS